MSKDNEVKEVPYQAISQGKTETYSSTITLPTGATVMVGWQPKGGKFIHRFKNPQPDGTRSVLEFALSPEACVALMDIYAAHMRAGHFEKPEGIA